MVLSIGSRFLNHLAVARTGAAVDFRACLCQDDASVPRRHGETLGGIDAELFQ
jgi:hypothetical protein